MRVSFDKLMISVLAVFTAFSGFLYFSPQGSFLAVNSTNRAIVLIFLFVFSIVLPITAGSKIRFIAVLLISPFLYMALISLLKMDGLYVFPSLLRWMAYLFIFIYFSSDNMRIDRLVLFINILAISFVLQAGVDILLDRGLKINGADRIGGGAGSPIGFAFALSVVGLANLYFFRKLVLNRYLFMSLILGLVIILTGTRSLFVAYFGIWGIFFILTSKSPLRLLLNTIVGTVLCGAVLYYVITATELGQRLLLQGDADSSTSFRLYLLGVVWREIDEMSVIFGSGLGGFPNWFFEKTNVENVAPHFEVIFIFIEGGIIGSIMYVFSVLYLIIYSFRLDREFRCFTTVLTSSILLLSHQLAFQFSNPTYFYQGMLPLFAILGFTLAKRSELIFPRPK